MIAVLATFSTAIDTTPTSVPRVIAGSRRRVQTRSAITAPPDLTGQPSASTATSPTTARTGSGVGATEVPIRGVDGPTA